MIFKRASVTHERMMKIIESAKHYWEVEKPTHPSQVRNIEMKIRKYYSFAI